MEAKDCKFYLKGGKCSHGDAPEPFVSECIGLEACEAWHDGIEEVGGQAYKIGHEQGFKAGIKEVIEDIEANYMVKNSANPDFLRNGILIASPEQWQAFKKRALSKGG